MEFIFEILIEFVGDVILCDSGELLKDAPKLAAERKVKPWVRIMVFVAITLIEMGIAIGLAVAGVSILKKGGTLAAVILFFLALLFMACWINALCKFVKGLRK